MSWDGRKELEPVRCDFTVAKKFAPAEIYLDCSRFQSWIDRLDEEGVWGNIRRLQFKRDAEGISANDAARLRGLELRAMEFKFARSGFLS